MTTTQIHEGLGSGGKKSTRVTAPPGGQDNMSGVFGGRGDPEPPRQTSAAFQRNSSVSENQENQRAQQYEQVPMHEEGHQEKRTAIRPSDDSFNNLGFGAMETPGHTSGGYKSHKKGQANYNIISHEYEGSTDHDEPNMAFGKRLNSASKGPQYNIITGE